MPYNPDNFYTPKNFNELEQDLLEQYNNAFSLSLTLEQFRYTNIYAVFLILLQHRLINENNLGLLFNKIISYLKAKQELEIIPKGATYVGLENALLQLKSPKNNKTALVTAIVLADNNNYPKACKVGEAYIVLEYETNQVNNKLIGECLASNVPLATTWLGSINYTAVSPITGNSYTFKWELLQTTNIKIKLHYKIKFDRVSIFIVTNKN